MSDFIPKVWRMCLLFYLIQKHIKTDFYIWLRPTKSMKKFGVWMSFFINMDDWRGSDWTTRGKFSWSESRMLFIHDIWFEGLQKWRRNSARAHQSLQPSVYLELRHESAFSWTWVKFHINNVYTKHTNNTNPMRTGKKKWESGTGSPREYSVDEPSVTFVILRYTSLSFVILR